MRPALMAGRRRTRGDAKVDAVLRLLRGEPLHALAGELDVPPQHVILAGRSLGSAVAVEGHALGRDVQVGADRRDGGNAARDRRHQRDLVLLEQAQRELQIRCELGDPVIEERNARLDRVLHRGLVLAVEQVREIRGELAQELDQLRVEVLAPQ